MNKLILIGNLTRDPEMRVTTSGVSCAKMTIAVPRAYSGADGEKKTDFFDLTVWREKGESCGRYLKKGSKIAVLGSVETRTYVDKDGVKRKTVDVKCDEVEFLSPKNAEQEGTDDPEFTEVDPDEGLPF